jgi:Predicted xylanase/chitin deacetylase
MIKKVAMKLYRWIFWIIMPVISSLCNIYALSSGEIPKVYVPVLCYHRVVPKVGNIYDVSSANLEEQLQFFKMNGYHPITAVQYLYFHEHPEKLPPKPIILTFDDDNKSHYQYVFPLLQQYGFKATFFVYPANIFQKNDYGLTWDQLLEMKDAGMDIESHTFSHPFLSKTKTNPDDPHYLKWLEYELKNSKKILEQKLHSKIEILAYPYGWYSCIVETKALEAGYQNIYSVNWGLNDLEDENPLRLKRRVVSNNLSLLEMDRYLHSKPLSMEINSPDDSAILSQKPEIRFKLISPKLARVDIVIDKYKGSLFPDSQGYFTFNHFETVYSGYYMIIVSGYDDKEQLYINSWGFNYRKPEDNPDHMVMVQSMTRPGEDIR